MMRALFPGSFDPVTLGHLDLINRARRHFEVVVAVGVNPAKAPWFSPAERMEMIEEALPGLEVRCFSGLVANFAQEIHADVIIKGIRGSADLDSEVSQAAVNRQIGGIETLFLPTAAQYQQVSSSMVRELAWWDAGVDAYVTPYTAQQVLRRAKERRAEESE